MGEEKRDFLRIPTRIKGNARILETPGEMPLFREFPLASSANMTLDQLRGALSDPLVNVLSTINNKLDMLLSLHSQQRMETDFPISLDVIEISGAGMRFRCAQELVVDQEIEVVLVLCQFPLRMAGAIGRVLRSEMEGGRQIWALDFGRIRDRDLEFIVQFVTQAQRDELREKKGL